MITSNASLKFYFSYQSVTVLLIIRYFFCDRESLLRSCREKRYTGIRILTVCSVKESTQSAK